MQDRGDADVLIIGAGVAGLAAAAALGHAGVPVKILEARSRIGGRILSKQNPVSPQPVELGAEFLHGAAREIFELASQDGLSVDEIAAEFLEPATPLEPATSLESATPRAARLKPVPSFWDDIEAITSRLSRVTEAHDRSFAEVLKSLPPDPALALQRRRAADYIEGFNAAELSRISARSLAISEGEASRPGGRLIYRMSGSEGYSSIPAALVRRIASIRDRLHLNTIVRDIRWRPHAVAILAGSDRGFVLGPFTAKRALITVPIGVLNREGDTGILFHPALPARKVEAMRMLESGAVHKIVLLLRKPFDELIHQKVPVSFLHARDQPFPTWWTAYPSTAPMITGWVGGGASLRLSAESPSPRAILEAAISSLAHAIGVARNRVEANLFCWELHDWQTDPFAQGAYSYVRVGGLEGQRIFSEPLEETLFFAGEATQADGRIGTVDGAIASGYRAAGEILRSLGRPRLPKAA